ncbi:hypothetical protein PVL29_004835 [Vitis rotundifolia]|uniref:Uncharacterized protein n=1 Tax=Vitis rotundifolia TaxID=103349 RepID=A0AA39E046_VITRO|nr:hypothetical protein PVL29_004835 [Vitis rotundifolia]
MPTILIQEHKDKTITHTVHEVLTWFGQPCLRSISEAFGNMTSLEYLCMSRNQLQGSIPEAFGNMVSLTYLDMSENQLQGSIPEAFGNMTSLERLYLNGNEIEGEIPKSLRNLCSLQALYLQSNNLSGQLPQDLLACAIPEAHLFHLSHLFHLDLSSNSLTFNMRSEWVPPFQLNWFWNLTSGISTINISNNQITGTLPNLSLKFGYSFYVDMSSSYLEGSIPQLPSHLRWLDLSNNKFSGSITLLCTVANSYLVYLDLSNNSLSGELPNCWPQWKSLIVLNLENNQFYGKIPKSFGSLQSIQTLHLRNNNLIGELPSSLKKCKSLSFIDLTKNRLFGKIPPWIGGNLPNLTICQLKKIQILDLSGNNISGTIPRCLNNFTAMTKKGSLTITYNFSSENPNSAIGDWSYVDRGLVKWKGRYWSYVDRELVKWKGREFEYKNTLGLVKIIDLSSNKLTEEIPKEVTDLLELVSLNFSRNNLTGLIPTTIGQLKSLDVLDLSQNQLIGEIPSSLSKIDRLSTLDLSNNNLSGKIPRGTQLQSFNASTYEGNPTLCGLPLLKKCPGDKAEGAPNASSYEDNFQQDGNDMWFYVSIALGFIVGFWGVCGTLLRNNSWRYSYFQFLNKIKDWLYVTTTINMTRLWRSLQS